jgi:tryptophanyl-tRNA synthetase
VPVGEDQKQHVELTRDVAQKFNRTYGEVFTVPEPWIGDAAARIMGLDEPTKKMSKSATGRYHAIFLTDTPEQIREKVKRATTDSVGTIVFDEERAGIFNLLSIYQAFTNEPKEAIEERFAGKGYGAFKQALADLIIDELRPLQENYARLAADPGYVRGILKEGADRVRPIAQETYNAARAAMGLA